MIKTIGEEEYHIITCPQKCTVYTVSLSAALSRSDPLLQGTKCHSRVDRSGPGTSFKELLEIMVLLEGLDAVYQAVGAKSQEVVK